MRCLYEPPIMETYKVKPGERITVSNLLKYLPELWVGDYEFLVVAQHESLAAVVREHRDDLVVRVVDHRYVRVVSTVDQQAHVRSTPGYL